METDAVAFCGLANCTFVDQYVETNSGVQTRLQDDDCAGCCIFATTMALSASCIHLTRCWRRRGRYCFFRCIPAIADPHELVQEVEPERRAQGHSHDAQDPAQDMVG